jgi:hypothetical protein
MYAGSSNRDMMTLEIEIECQTLSKALLSTNLDAAYEGVLLRQIELLMASSFNDTKFFYTPRSCNFVAHMLPSEGAPLDDGNATVWLENFPIFVPDLVH